MIHYLAIRLTGEVQIWRAVRFRTWTHVKPHFPLIVGIELERLHGAAVVLGAQRTNGVGQTMDGDGRQRFRRHRLPYSGACHVRARCVLSKAWDRHAQQHIR
jgi:hypothetical protein